MGKKSRRRPNKPASASRSSAARPDPTGLGARLADAGVSNQPHCAFRSDADPLDVAGEMSNMKLTVASDASPGDVVYGNSDRNMFFEAFGSLGIGDRVSMTGTNLGGRVVGFILSGRGMVRVALDGGRVTTYTAARVAVTSPAAPYDLRATCIDVQAKAGAQADALAELDLPPKTLAAIRRDFPQRELKVPSAEALEVLPRRGETVKICESAERFWVSVTSVTGDTVEGLVNNELTGGQPFAALGSRIKFEKRHIYMIEAYAPPTPTGMLDVCKCARAVDHFRDALKDLPEAYGEFAARHWVEDYDAFNSFVPVESPAAVEAWFRAEAKTDPTLLEGSGLDAEDIGVFHKNSLEKCSGVRYAYHNLGNMVLLPRVDVVLMKAAGLG